MSNGFGLKYEEEKKIWDYKIISKCSVCNGEQIIRDRHSSHTCQCAIESEINTRLSLRNFPKRYLTWSWDDCEDKKIAQKCKVYCDNFYDNYEQGMGLYLYGEQGRGKTTLETIMAKEIFKKKHIYQSNKNFNTIFIMAAQLIDLTFKNKAFIDEFKKVDLLVIDNLGSEKVINSDNKYGTLVLDEILRQRTNNSLPTIISSNFTLDEIEKYYSKTIKDLINKFSYIIGVDSSNFRTQLDLNDTDIDEILE